MKTFFTRSSNYKFVAAMEHNDRTDITLQAILLPLMAI